MTVTYRPASEPKRIAERLIPKHHDHLAGERVDFVFRSEAAKSGGKIVLGKARKLSGLNAFLASDPDEIGQDEEVSFFVIELAEDMWAELTEEQRVALVDHELCHCKIKHGDNGPTLVIQAHDLEEFREIVDRHGLWQPDLTRFANSIAGAVQLQFGDTAAEHPQAASIVDAIADAATDMGATVEINGNGTRTVTLDADQIDAIRDRLDRDPTVDELEAEREANRQAVQDAMGSPAGDLL